MEIGKAGHARSSSLSYPPAPKPYQPSSTPFPYLEPAEVPILSLPPPYQLPLSLPQSLNQSQWQPAERRNDLTSWRIAKQEKGVERLLWKKLVRQLLAVSVTAERESEALALCVELESDLWNSRAVSEVLVRFTEKALGLYTKEQRDEPDREFLVSLLEQQNAQLAELQEQESAFQSASKEALEGRIASLTAELQSLRNCQLEHQQALDLKLKAMEEGRKLAAREKTALQEAYSRLSLSLQVCTKEKSQLEAEITTLRKQLHLESCEKLQIAEDLAKSARSLESSRLRIYELEQELASSPFSHLHSIGEQLGTQFATVSDLFAYLTANLEASDPDQMYLLEAYKGLSGLGTQLQAPSFIAAMLSFLLIRKKMIEEERELQGNTLLGLKKQLETAQMELEAKAKAYFRVSLEANELKLQAKTLTLEADLQRKQAAGSEEELKVLKKAHERHIELYRTELDSVQRRLAAAERSALDKGLEVEALHKERGQMAGKLAALEEEIAALEHENSFLAYEKSELQKGYKHKYGSESLQELNATLNDIQQALKKQQVHEKELEMVISSLHLQLEDRETALSQAEERGQMATEEMAQRDRERLGLRTGGLRLRADRDHLAREVAELAQQIAYLYRENEDLAEMLGSDRLQVIESKYTQLKGLYSRLEGLCGRLLPISTLSSANASVTDMDGKELQLREIEKVLDLEPWDQASEVVRTEESAISAGNSLFAGEKRVIGSVRLQGVLWTLRADGPEHCYWTRQGEDWEETGRRLGVYQELEALVQPYMREFEDLTLAFSRILQDYEQLGRSRPVSPEPSSQAYAEDVKRLVRALSSADLSL